MRETDLRAQFETMDRAVREGRGMAVRAEIERIFKKKIPRSLQATAAQLARRTGRADLAVELLHPLVRGTGRAGACATASEIAEYAAALAAIGGVQEAFTLLLKIDERTCPRALLYRTFCLTPQWDYEATIPLLRAFLAHPLADPYDRTVAGVNHAAALAAMKKTHEALGLIDTLLKDTQEKGNERLRGNLFELRAQIHLAMRDFVAADADLRNAERVLGSVGARDLLWVRKWRAVARCLSNPSSDERFAELHAVREEATRQGAYETVRDCDRHEAVLRGDMALGLHVYFGTPHEAFRERLVAEMKGLTLPRAYHRVLHPGDSPVTIDTLLEGKDNHWDLKAGQLVHRLLVEMSSDFYRPLRLVEIHHQLYPGEYYNPRTSPLKVHQAIRQLRGWIKSKRLPLSLEESGGAYRLSATAPCVVRCAFPGANLDVQSVFLRRLHEHWPSASFNVSEVAAFAGLSQRRALSHLQDGVSSGHLIREGKGRATRYRCVMDTPAIAA